MVFCPNCYSNALKRNGYDRKKAQKYKCLRCKKNFTQNTDSQLSGMRYPKSLITYALTLHYRHEMTFREVSEEFKKRGIEISYVTIFNWAKKFGGVFERSHGGWRPYTKVWHITNDLKNVNGEKMYVGTVRDSNRNMLAVRIAKKRIGSRCLIGDAAALVGFKPETMMGADVEMFKSVKEDVEA